MSEDRLQLWFALFFVGGFCAYSWYWWIRSIIFYRRNGFDFTKDFGPELYQSDRGGEDDCVLEKPRDKLLIAWPLWVVVTSVTLLFIILGLLGVFEPNSS
ncbi:hypothetical protein [Rhizobium sp. 1399]|uniref:hypothetical protein n=1 Tax=Rhizobium sp. 1399 TaxID=2817758 RepID=UPI00285E18F4|nr:hypothetical protein [Rhizobium sp. 1399]MDR6670458.1 hypothetical protein [Rhizobium sp. 1399]